jgi:hypothetical protein
MSHSVYLHTPRARQSLNRTHGPIALSHICSDSSRGGDLPSAPAYPKASADASPRRPAPLPPPPVQRKSLQGGHDPDSAVVKAEAAARLAGRSGSMHEEL